METSQAIVLPPVQPPLYSRPEGCDCLLPRLGALAYQTIDSENGDIRLVELLPGRYSDVVQMNLHTKNLGDKPNYEALSYAWGTTPSSNRAIINGCPVPVRESLDLGLRRLRLADQPRMLWIDALCINQSDVRERSHQVQLMCRIYKSAKQVVIWLGEFPDLNSCPNSQQCQTEWIQWVESWKSGRIRTTPLLHHCQHAIEVSKLPWFRRLWIIQEFLLAFNTPDTMLGNVVTDSSSLFSALQECLGFLLRHPVTPESERKQIKQLDTHLSFLIDMFRHSMRFGPRKSLYVTSAMSQHAIATDPRDRIYGLLGITKAYVAEPILPDYSKAWPQVIAEATIVMISEDGLFPYMHADFAFPSADLFENCYRTPSWVLDFSRVMSDNCPISFSNYWGHRLSREGIERRRKSLRLSDDFRTLYKHGWYIGTTTKTFALACIPNTSGTAISQAAELYDFYHTVLKPKGIAPSRMYDALDARLGCEFHLEDFTPSLLGHRDRFLQGFEFWGTTLSHTCRFAMFLTEEGDIGLTWLHTTFEIRADDILVALFERHMPFILRPVRGDSTYRMINLACISGRSREYSRSYMLSSERMMDVPHDWVYDAAECCSEYAIV
jgi:hypothetical protein